MAIGAIAIKKHMAAAIVPHYPGAKQRGCLRHEAQQNHVSQSNEP
jgi:hypothetical protein